MPVSKYSAIYGEPCDLLTPSEVDRRFIIKPPHKLVATKPSAKLMGRLSSVKAIRPLAKPPIAKSIVLLNAAAAPVDSGWRSKAQEVAAGRVIVVPPSHHCGQLRRRTSPARRGL